MSLLLQVVQAKIFRKMWDTYAAETKGPLPIQMT